MKSMRSKIKIGDTIIGNHKPCFIIAEAGVNHNGKLELAKKLVIEANKAGADCVKFQTFTAKGITTLDAPKANYQLLTTNPAESQREMLKKLELKRDDYITLMKLCEKVGILFLSTPYSFEDVDFLDTLGVAAFKLASIHLTELPMVRYVAKKQKPLFLSTGMSTMEEVKRAVREFKKTGNRDLILLQCTTNYPSKPEDANLLVIPTLKEQTGCLVGYSDHVPGINACLCAVSLGASVIEKHFTLDTRLPGPDHSSSSEPKEFSAMVKMVREVELLKGAAVKRLSTVEKVNAKNMRRSLVALTLIPKGTKVTASMIGFKRPATGLAPNLYDKVIEKVAKKDILPDELLKRNSIQW